MPRASNALALFIFLVILSLLGACNLPAGSAVSITQAPELGRSEPASTPEIKTTSLPTAMAPVVTPTPASAIAVDAQRLGLQTVRFWHPWQNQAGEAMTALVNEFKRE